MVRFLLSSRPSRIWINGCFRSDLASTIRQLHKFGIHHHDMVGNTVVDEHGTVRLVDFHQAELVPPGANCPCCNDRDSLMVLELDVINSE